MTDDGLMPYLRPMNTLDIITATEKRLKTEFEGESTGHDWWHVDRVRRIALMLAAQEGADTQIVELGALLHDIADWKFNGGDEEAGPRETRRWLESLDARPEVVQAVVEIVEQVTFKGAGVQTPTSTIEAAVVQDADRLDALGAIGIARAFAYGGSRSRPLWDPGETPELHAEFEAYRKKSGSTIAHFHEKLLLLKDRMQTESGKALAENRHAFMLKYLEQFKLEWEGTK